MKLYATTTSERGKPVYKSGNEYLSVHIRKVSDRQNDAMSIMAYATGEIVIVHDENVNVRISTFKSESKRIAH